MRRRLTIGVLAALAATSLLAASGARGSVAVGDNCIGDAPVTDDYTLTTLAAPGTVTAPSSGVITQLRSNLPPIPFTIPTNVKVLRNVGVPLFTVVNQVTMNQGPG